MSLAATDDAPPCQRLSPVVASCREAMELRRDAAVAARFKQQASGTDGMEVEADTGSAELMRRCSSELGAKRASDHYCAAATP